jgi:hypothetical protein
MDAQIARTKLLAQHEQIRADLASCVALARRLRDGESPRAAFDVAIAQLRFDIDEHTASETLVILEVLQDAADWGTVLVDRMIEEHVGAHEALWAALVGSSEDVAGRMQDLAEQLDAHMAAEGRTFLSPQVLRGEVITRHLRKDSSG